MAEDERDPTHNIGADPLEAEPSAGRGGKETDPIPEQVESAERLKGSEHPVSGGDDGEGAGSGDG